MVVWLGGAMFVGSSGTAIMGLGWERGIPPMVLVLLDLVVVAIILLHWTSFSVDFLLT